MSDKGMELRIWITAEAVQKVKIAAILANKSPSQYVQEILLQHVGELTLTTTKKTTSK